MLIYLGWILLLGFSFDILSFAKTWKAVSKYKYNFFFFQLKSLQQEIDQDKLTLSNLKFEIQDLKVTLSIPPWL